MFAYFCLKPSPSSEIIWHVFLSVIRLFFLFKLTFVSLNWPEVLNKLLILATSFWNMTHSRLVHIETLKFKSFSRLSDLLYRVLQKKRNPDSKFYISNTNKGIVILQTALYASTFCSLLVKFSNEIEQKCQSSNSSKKCCEIFAWHG